MKKRILSFLLVAVMLLGMMPAVMAAADSTSPAITSYNWVLDGILSVNFKVDAKGQSMDGYSVRMQIGEDDTYQEITDYTVENGLYVYTGKVMAHRLNETLTVSLMNGQTVVQNATKTIAEYVAAQKLQYPNSAELHALLDAMVSYGKYAANYKNENADFTGDSAVEAITAADLENYGFTVEGTIPAGLKPVAALYLDEACDLKVKFDAQVAEGHTLYVNGEAVTMEPVETQLVYTRAQMLPQDWDTVYDFELKNADGEAVFKMTYSVLSYVKAALKSTGGTGSLAGLVKAMFLYWSKAEAYIADPVSLHKAVVLPDAPIGTLWDGNATGYTLVFNRVNDPEADTAASMINRVVRRLTGKDSGIGYCWGYDGQTNLDKYPTWSETAKYIVIGDEALFQAAGLTMPMQDLGETGYYIVTRGASVFIMPGANADPVQSFQLATIRFLELVLGYEMYGADSYGYAYSGTDTITVPTMEIIERSDYDYRMQATGSPAQWPYQLDMGYTTATPMGLVNGEMYHTIFSLMDYTVPSTILGSIPDYMYRAYDSDWNGYYYQPCFTKLLANSDGIYDTVYANLKEVVLADTEHDIFTVGTEDNPVACNCNDCKANPAKPYIQFVNELARDLAADTDLTGRDITLLAMAYRGYQAPPAGITARENVAVMYAPIEAEWDEPLSTQPAYAAELEGWSAVTDHLYCWFYQTNFNSYLFPMNSWSIMDDNIRYARDLGADFIFYQGAHGAKSVSHFTTLKTYLEKKLTFNADANYELLVDDFFDNYFGPASASMRAYFDALQAHMVSAGVSGNYDAAPVKSQWPQAKLQEFMGYITQAQADVQGSADAALYLKHINLESFFPRYALLSFYNDTATAGTKGALQAEYTELCGNKYDEHVTFDSQNSGWVCSHSYTAQTAANRYLAAPANTQAAAKYFLSCASCGAIGTETFDYGTAIQTVAWGDVELKADSNEAVTLTATGISGTASAVSVNGTALSADSYSLSGDSLTLSKAVLQTYLGQNVEITVTTNSGSYPYTAFVVSKVIKTAAEFVNLMTYLDKTDYSYTGYLALGNDIDLSGNSGFTTFFRPATSGANSIGTTSGAANGFNGTLDGRGYAVTNISMATWGEGLFGSVAQNAVFKDISLKFGDVTNDYVLARAFFGKLEDVYISVGDYKGDLLWITQNTAKLNRVVIECTGTTGDVAYLNSDIATDSYILGTFAEGTKFVGMVNYASRAEMAAANKNYDVFTATDFWMLDDYGTPIPVQPIRVRGNIDLARSNAVNLTESVFGTITSVKVNGVAKDPADYAVNGKTMSIPAEDKPATAGEHVVLELVVNGQEYTIDLVVATFVINNTENLATLANWGEDTRPGSGYYVLGQDIDLAAYTMSNGLFGAKTFSGTLDGMGYKLMNLSTGSLIKASASTAVIKNIGFTDLTATHSGYNTLFRMNGGGSFENVYIELASWTSSSLIQHGNQTVTLENVIIEYTAGETLSGMNRNLIYDNVQLFGCSNFYFIGAAEGTKNATAYATRAAMAAAAGNYSAFTSTGFWTLDENGTPVWG